MTGGSGSFTALGAETCCGEGMGHGLRPSVGGSLGTPMCCVQQFSTVPMGCD